MTLGGWAGVIGAGLGAVRWARLAAIVLLALAAGLASDWLRRDRVVFPRPLPEFMAAPLDR
jgi:hypothetical protein